jgi:hypothetical protein
MLMILLSYASNIFIQAAYQTWIDVVKSNNRTMDSRTFDEYMDARKNFDILEDIDGWNTNLLSKSIVSSTFINLNCPLSTENQKDLW